MKEVKIKWMDSCTSNSGWILTESIEDIELVEIATYGVVVGETDQYIAVAQNYGTNPEQVCNVITIPKGCIMDIVFL